MYAIKKYDNILFLYDVCILHTNKQTNTNTYTYTQIHYTQYTYIQIHEHAHKHTIFRIHKQTHTYTHTHKVAFCCFEVSLVVNHTQLSKVDAKKKSTASPSSLQKLILSAGCHHL